MVHKIEYKNAWIVTDTYTKLISHESGWLTFDRSNIGQLPIKIRQSCLNSIPHIPSKHIAEQLTVFCLHEKLDHTIKELRAQIK